MSPVALACDFLLIATAKATVGPSSAVTLIGIIIHVCEGEADPRQTVYTPAPGASTILATEKVPCILLSKWHKYITSYTRSSLDAWAKALPDCGGGGGRAEIPHGCPLVPSPQNIESHTPRLSAYYIT